MRHSGWAARKTEVRGVFAAALLVAAVLSTPAIARAQAKYDHWGIIETSMKELDGLNKVGSATPQQLNKLADNLMQRGQVYLDLYDLQRVLVRDHARMLDSAGKSGSTSYAAASYFLARALHEFGDVTNANAAYKRASASAPPALRTLANDWSAAATGSGGASWQQSVAAWRSGKPVSRVTCAPGNIQCALFQAIVADDIVALAKLQRDINKQPTPDYTESVTGKSGPVSVEFYDPLTLYLLSVADFTMAAKILTGQKDYAAWRGIALLRVGKYKEAEATLKPLVAAGGAVAAAVAPMLGDAMYRQKNSSAAEQQWRAASGSALNVVADVKSALGLDSAAVVRQFANEQRAGLDQFLGGREGGLYLARALLRFNLLTQADDLLDGVRPATRGTSASTVQPDELALLAHSEYRLGRLPNFRDRYVAARADLQGIAELSPLVNKMLQQLQQVTLLMEGDAKSRG